MVKRVVIQRVLLRGHERPGLSDDLGEVHVLTIGRCPTALERRRHLAAGRRVRRRCCEELGVGGIVLKRRCRRRLRLTPIAGSRSRLACFWPM
jgi:hypothetical protein